MFDLRFPLGSLFVVLGFVMTVFGFVSRNNAIYDRSLGANVNLIWGLVEIAFGAILLWLSRSVWEKKP